MLYALSIIKQQILRPSHRPTTFETDQYSSSSASNVYVLVRKARLPRFLNIYIK